VEKVRLGVSQERWDQALEYISSRPELEDVVVSGGDTYNLKPDQIRFIGQRLLRIKHLRRLRFATKGPAVMPQKLLTDTEWVDALTWVVERGRRMHKEVAVHTHFNHPNEITGVTQDAMGILMERGITVRNQTVLQRGVNADGETMRLLVKRLSHVNVQPYYVFFHDLVSGVEDLRTTLEEGLDIERQVRGTTAGFNTPTFVVDTMGGGGKRDAHSHEHYDRDTGIAVFTSPTVRPGAFFCYFDPIHRLDEEARMRWADPDERRPMVQEALKAAGAAIDS
jgi:lysine 2,3-aminomutase